MLLRPPADSDRLFVGSVLAAIALNPDIVKCASFLFFFFDTTPCEDKGKFDSRQPSTLLKHFPLNHHHLHPPFLLSSLLNSTQDVSTPSADMDSSPFYNQNHNNPRFKEGHASFITTASSATSFYPPSDWASTPLPLPRPKYPSPQPSYISSSSSGSAYTNTTHGTQARDGSSRQQRQPLGGGRPPLPQFPASFQKHFAASPRKDRTPPPLDLSEARISPQKKRENHPVISTTPSPRMTSYGSIIKSNVATAPPPPPPHHQQRRSSQPFTPLIPVSPQTPLLPSPLSRSASPSSYNTTTNMDSDPDAYVAPPPITPSRFKRFSRRWGLEGDEAKEVEKARRRVDREMASLEKERREMKKFEKEENQWEKERRRQAEEELEGALRVWSPLRFGRGGQSENGGGGLGDSQRSYRSGRGGGGFMCFGSRGGKDEKGGNGESDEKRRKKKRLIWIGLILLILILIAGVTVLLVKLLANKSSSSSSTTSDSSVVTVSGTQTVTLSNTQTSSLAATKTSSASASSSPSASAAPVITLTSCLADFPPASNTTNYCTTCTPFLSAATNDFASDGTESTGVGKALQYCGMRSIYEAVKTKSDGSRVSSTADLGGAMNQQNSPWFATTDGSVCTWGGVTCDSTGRVIQLNLTYPAVPDAIPSAIGNLVALQTLEIYGNTVAGIPSGALPTTLYSLSKLTSLTIESTSITTPIPNSAFSQTTNLQSLTLRYNAGFGTSLPTGLGGTSLTTLIVNGQSLSGGQFAYLPSSLTYLDLSYNSLTALASDLATSLPNVLTLLVTSNSVASLPSSFPPNIQSLALDGNTGLSGMLPSSLCLAQSLTKCTVEGTSLTGSTSTVTVVGNLTTTVTSCGVCVF
ncbi:hypothetical protein BDY24DRAFT_415083 [Mrakia frigida]|uniref:uncharacterized protein n=1 Tax=Mrakia frigida TaxID=29902 RepID=UPI003FCC23E4